MFTLSEERVVLICFFYINMFNRYGDLLLVDANKICTGCVDACMDRQPVQFQINSVTLVCMSYLFYKSLKQL